MIPLKLETLLEGRIVEQDRVEYKKGWNPNETIHTICAYANDFSNTNGGYIVIGVDAKNGQPVLPPEGLPKNKLDEIQREIFQYCNFIEPRYIPKLEVLKHQRKWVIFLWCPGGNSGPYKVPKDVLAKGGEDRHKDYWIKPFSVKTVAKGEELAELFEKFSSVPFDDRVNQKAKITDVRRAYVEDFLRESNSSLISEINTRSVEDLLVAMEAANRTDVGVDIRNIGVLMFFEHPEKLVPEAKIELIRFHTEEAEAGVFTEKTFTGPIFKQVRDTLEYIETTLIEEKVVKVSGRAEADRFYNYVYDALEEVLVNSVFHKSYLIPEPVEIRIYVDCIKIINYPGPAKTIDMEDFRAGTAIARRYRNRRIGEFLKDIDLSEKKSTGIKKVLTALAQNGSPPPEFKTDAERSYLISTIRMHEGFEPAVIKAVVEPEDERGENMQDSAEDSAEDGAEDGAEVKLSQDRLDALLDFCSEPRSRKEMQDFCGIKSDEYFRRRIVLPMLALGLVRMTIPEKPNSKNQKYIRV